jgi:hypothetical protein
VPVFGNRIVLELAHNFRAFLDLELGLTRDRVPEKRSLAARVENLDYELRQTREQSKKRAERLEEAQRLLAEKEQEIAKLWAMSPGTFAASWHGGIDPGNIVWIFGTARTGSTWLSSMLAELTGNNLWNEPYAGAIFAPTFYKLPWRLIGERNDSLLSHRYKHVWLKSVRSLVLEGASVRFPDVGEKEYLIAKDPHGSPGAPVLMEALPESRIILLVRDPRDVVASVLDSYRGGRWEKGWEQVDSDDPEALTRTRAALYLDSVGRAKQAYDAHQGRKALVRYEDLRVDPSGNLKCVCSCIGVPADERKLAETVKKHSWEEIPEERKGEGKFYRKARAGGWQEDLTARQAEIVEEITAPLLREFYPG